MKRSKSTRKSRTSPTTPDNFVLDCLFIAGEFLKGAKILFQQDPYLLSVYGYLASHAAELYLKAYLIKLNPSERLYKKLRDISHDLSSLLDEVASLDKNAEGLKTSVNALNKFSGAKIRYPEFRYNPKSPDMYGSDEVFPHVDKIKSYVEKKL